MKIAIDAMGGDHAPHNEVLGALRAVKMDESIYVVLVGKKNLLEEELAKHEKSDRISIVHADDIITMHESPVKVLKEKKPTSLRIGLKLLKDKEVDAFVSAGNTGAVMALSIFNLGRIKGVERPAIVALFPTIKKPLVILDIGANVDCKPKHLVQFAKMGSVFCEKVLNNPNPKVKLLNIGEEEEKGNELTTETYQLLKNDKEINFDGNIEPGHLLDGNTDIVVCDGFVGNVILKFGESAVRTLGTIIKEEVKKSILATIGGIFLIPAFKKVRKKTDYDEIGGTMLLGVKNVVIIAHGSASPKAISNAILEAKKVKNENVIEKIEEVLSN
ncbi:MAG: phosphate acyltransferase [Candidatus Margulisbacteria bacterium GWF2_35_9]|nr:MAG: phosphate acyltransferase [Candidatus Margulisbacteria bacterium GWF2_35_9]